MNYQQISPDDSHVDYREKDNMFAESPHLHPNKQSSYPDESSKPSPFSFTIEKTNPAGLTIPENTNPYSTSLIFEASLALSVVQIRKSFEEVCKRKKYQIIDDEGEHITALYKTEVGIKDMIMSCFYGKKNEPENITAIRLSYKTNKVTCQRKIILKWLYGDLQRARNFFSDFTDEIGCELASPVRKDDEKESMKTNNEDENATRMKVKDEENEFVEHVSNENLESYSFYQFRKILSADQYSVGKKVSIFIQDFHNQHKSLSESAALLPKPLEKISTLIQEVTETFFADFNYGKSETKQMMPYCRISVEKYIFDKLYDNIFELYKFKYQNLSMNYKAKVKEIIQRQDCISQFTYLDIPQKFWTIKKDQLTEDFKLVHPLDEREMPFRSAILEVQRMPSVKSPREKLSILLMTHSLMKSSVVDYHKGKEEIGSMDEELPLLIYIMLNANIENIGAELHFVEDYVNADPILESDKRLMTNLTVTVKYIAEEWKIPNN